MNGLYLNILTKEEDHNLDLIDKIIYLKRKETSLSRYIKVVKEGAHTSSYKREKKDLK